MIIAFLVVLNLYLSIVSLKNVFFRPNDEIPIKPNWGETERHIPPPFRSIAYSPEELEEAVKGMNLPTWSRSYVPCDDPKSEVTCSQTVQAWRTLNGWAVHMNETRFEDRKHLMQSHRYDGVGNRFSTDTTSFIVALMDNRTYIMNAHYPSSKGQAHGQAFIFHPQVVFKEQVAQYVDSHELYSINAFDGWYYIDYPSVYAHVEILHIDWLLYATMAYAHQQLSDFCIQNFGMHAAYFVCNFLMTIPASAINEARRVADSVPPNVRIFGCHLRLQFPGQFYSYSVDSTMEWITPFLKSRMIEMPTIFAFASDSPLMEDGFSNEFGNFMIKTSAIRRADYDHDSALFDVALMEMADELLISYRSTFSYVCAMRSLKRAWFIDKEGTNVFHASHSQATAVSALFHHWDVNDWQVNRRFHIFGGNERALRYYYKYLLL